MDLGALKDLFAEGPSEHLSEISRLMEEKRWR